MAPTDKDSSPTEKTQSHRSSQEIEFLVEEAFEPTPTKPEPKAEVQAPKVEPKKEERDDSSSLYEFFGI